MDLRHDFFNSGIWYQDLERPRDGETSAWFVAKGPVDRAHVALANCGLAFAIRHGLEGVYRSRFAGIASKDLAPQRAKAEYRTVTFPIFQILHELIVAALLERGLGWRFVMYEPPGHRSCRGEWEFALESGKHIFVEVKSLGEPHYSGSGVFTKPRYAPRIQATLKRAYRQLPEDKRATVVVLVSEGTLMLDMPAGIMFGDLFQAFFGETIVAFRYDGQQLQDPRLTSTFKDMFVQKQKNRRLGAVFGLYFGGIGKPVPVFYALHNPFSRADSALPLEATEALTRFYVNEHGEPHFPQGLSGESLWQRTCG